MQKKDIEKVIPYKKPEILATTKQNKNFSSGCMSGNANCLHCRKN